MNQEQREHLFDLLTQKVTYGLDSAEQAELDALGEGVAVDEFALLELTAAAINLSEASSDEMMPDHLYSKIVTDAAQYVGGESAVPEVAQGAAPEQAYVRPAVSTSPTGSSWFGWLGWAAAAAACIALAINIWAPRPTTRVAVEPPRPVQTPQPMTPAEMREAMMASTAGLVKATWGAGNMKELKQVTGDIVWSDEKQAGYMRFRGLPVNDAKKETYQLWIFDKTQDKATPIDGGTFDVSSDGEVVIPINAKLKAEGPAMFAITVEKPGGVVVSKREKVAALAQVTSGTS